MTFNPLNFPIVTQSPRLLSDVSAWVEHIPLAFALVQLARPRLLVELGTHKGDSYCAFCQAVDTLKLDTRCFAVDTWSGDAHAGTYSTSVLNELRDHHDALYARFSTLVPSTFDDAVARFENASIDFLHIDGLHTYDAVKHDFETWRPKLSDRAVVLFHDTAVTTGDFGVHTLWRELTANSAAPHFEFNHGPGLGVLALGPHCEPALVDFLATANAQPVAVRDYFAALGQRLELVRGLFQIIGQSRRHYEQVVSWRRARALAERESFPVGFTLQELLLAGRPEFKEAFDHLVQTVRLNTNDAYALLRDDESVRAVLAELRARLNEQPTREQPTRPKSAGG